MGKTTRSIRSTRRREELRRLIPQPVVRMRDLLQKQEFLNAALILLAFIGLTSGIVGWSREQPKVRDNQVMTMTRLKRLNYDVVDDDATTEKRVG